MKEKFYASAIHCVLSFTILLLVYLWISTYWFPPPHFIISGGIQGLAIIIPVDFILGPVLTYVVYNSSKSKSELIRDLSIIAVLQIVLLSYGVRSVYSQRVVIESVIFNGVIGTPTFDQLKKNNKAFKAADLKKFDTGVIPRIAYVGNPNNMRNIESLKSLFSLNNLVNNAIIKKAKNYNPILVDKFSALKDDMASIGAEFKFYLYEPVNNLWVVEKLRRASQNGLAKLLDDKSNREQINNFLVNKKDSKINSFMFFELRAKYGSAIKVLNKSGEPVTYLNVKRYK